MQDNFAYLLPFIMLSFGMIFLFMRSLGNRSALFWGLGYICAALGFAAPMLIVTLPLEVQAIASNAVFFAAFYFYGHALLVHFDRPPMIAVRASIGMAALVLVSASVLLMQDLRRELIVGDLACVLLLAVPVWCVIKRAKVTADRLLVAVVSLVVVETLVRVALLVLMTPNGSMVELSEFFASDYAYFMQVGASLLGFLMGLAVLASLVSGVLGKHVHAAEHDPLTDILNRRGFDRVAPDFRDDMPTGTVITCDIDHFKQINDQYGHAAGDIVIISLSELLSRSMPQSAVVARFGGEEFVAYLPDYQLAEAGILANAIRMEFAGRDWRSRGMTQQITASFGVSALARGDHSIHDAIGRADASLYMAKSAGRNQVVLEGARIAAPQPLKVISTN